MKKEDQNALVARIAALEAKLEPSNRQPQPAPAPIQIDGVRRDYNGRPIADPNAPSWEERQKRRRAETKAAQAAETLARSAGLPPGLWRDPTGLVRNSDGRLAKTVEREMEAKAEVAAEMAMEHKANLERDS